MELSPPRGQGTTRGATAPATPATIAGPAETPWLPTRPPDDGSPALLCFPHAGAGASSFRPWEGALREAHVCPVQLPGREDRFPEEPFRTVGPLVDAALDALAPALRGPFAVYGHSVGALVAYEFTRALRRAGGPRPVHLFVSGRVAPQLRNPGSALHELPEPEFLRFVHSMGGIPAHALRSRAFAELIVPLLRADISVNETYAHREEEPLDLPLTALAGHEDPRVPTDWVRPWAAHTKREFAFHVLPGGHFFPYEGGGAVPALIDATLRGGA